MSLLFNFKIWKFVFDYPLEQKLNIKQKEETEEYVTHIGEKCLDKCDNYGEEYSWCNTGTGYTGWDYCSPKSGKPITHFVDRTLNKILKVMLLHRSDLLDKQSDQN